MSLSVNILYSVAFPPGLWKYYVRLGSAFPLDPYFLHVHNQAGGFFGSAKGRDIRGSGLDSVLSPRG